MKFLAFFKSITLFFILFSSVASANIHDTGWFKITELFISHGNNLHFRVFGMGNTLPCATNDWAYIDENDSGAIPKIATMNTAYAGKKNVRLIVEPKNYYGD